MKYRRKEVISAVQFDEKNPHIKVKYFMGCDNIAVSLTNGYKQHSEIRHIPFVDTYEHGWVSIKDGDYILSDSDGRISIMSKDKFEHLYENIT